MCKVTKAIAHIFQAGAGIWEGVRHNTMLQSVRFLGAGVSAQERGRKNRFHPLPDPHGFAWKKIPKIYVIISTGNTGIFLHSAEGGLTGAVTFFVGKNTIRTSKISRSLAGNDTRS